MILHSASTIEHYVSQGFWGHKTLLDLLAQHVADVPQRPCVVDTPDRAELIGTPATAVTWQQFGAAVDAIATGLLRQGLQKDEVVVAQLPNVWELMALYFAVARAGGILSPIAMQWRDSELRNVAEVSQAKRYIGVKDFKGFDHIAMAQRVGYETLALEEITAMAAQAPDPALLARVKLDANDIFSLCWSSGTESHAKGCPMSHNNWLFQMRLIPEVVGIQEGDRVLAPAPMVNMTGAVAWMSWLSGRGTLLLHHPINVELLIRQMLTENVQFTILVPAILNMILKLPNVDSLNLSSIRSIATGSAPPSRWSMEEFKRRWNIEICNLWGQTEGTGVIAGPRDVPDFAQRSDHFPWWGKPGLEWPSKVQGIQIKLLDDADCRMHAAGPGGRARRIVGPTYSRATTAAPTSRRTRSRPTVSFARATTSSCAMSATWAFSTAKRTSSSAAASTSAPPKSKTSCSRTPACKRLPRWPSPTRSWAKRPASTSCPKTRRTRPRSKTSSRTSSRSAWPFTSCPSASNTPM